MVEKITHIFRWHDSLCEGDYDFGGNGYLSMDGSHGRIQCIRKLTPPAGGAGTAIELSFRVVLGRVYEVRLIDEAGEELVTCQFESEGWVSFRGKDRKPSRTQSTLTYAYGIPVVDPAPRSDLHVRESDEMTLVFSDFSLGDGDQRGFRFTLGEEQCETVDLPPGSGREIAAVEIYTPEPAPGTVFRLKRFASLAGEAVLEEDTFPTPWQPVAPPATGYPYDHISEIRLYPKDFRWLQTVTQYGWVKLPFPRMESGRLAYTLMTPDISREAALLLEESHPTIEQGCRAHTGIVRNRFFYAGPERKRSDVTKREYFQDRLFYIDDPVPEANRIYRFEVSWNPEGYGISVDGRPLALDGREHFPFEMANKPYRGIDTLTLHPGTFGTRMSSLQSELGRKSPETLPDPHIAFWGDFEIEER